MLSKKNCVYLPFSYLKHYLRRVRKTVDYNVKVLGFKLGLHLLTSLAAALTFIKPCDTQQINLF